VLRCQQDLPLLPLAEKPASVLLTLVSALRRRERPNRQTRIKRRK
jgi:hypothetical protein